VGNSPSLGIAGVVEVELVVVVLATEDDADEEEHDEDSWWFTSRSMLPQLRLILLLLAEEVELMFEVAGADELSLSDPLDSFSAGECPLEAGGGVPLSLCRDELAEIGTSDGMSFPLFLSSLGEPVSLFTESLPALRSSVDGLDDVL
jgi:hypothetical protein